MNYRDLTEAQPLPWHAEMENLLRFQLGRALRAGMETPVAALLIAHNGVTLGSGENQSLRFTAHEPGVSDALHAEIAALADAAARGNNLMASTVFVTREPCAACCAALRAAGVSQVFVIPLTPHLGRGRWEASIRAGRRFLQARMLPLIGEQFRG